MTKLNQFLFIFIFSLMGIFQVSAQYCTPTYTYKPSLYNMYIDRVRLGDIDKNDATTPDETSYDDYTQYGPWTNLTRGILHNITINAGPNSYPTYMYYAAWIDYNKDGDFTDAGEKLGEFHTSTVSQQFNISFTVPATTPFCTTRLRIRCVYYPSTGYSNVDPCSNYLYGETEDYTIGISDFLKTVTTVPGAEDWDASFFNLDGDADYDLIALNEYSDVAPVNFYTNNGSAVFSSNAYINSVTPVFKDYNLSYSLCDLNNDNGIDVLFTSRYNELYPRTLYFQKSGTNLYQTTISIADLMRGSSEAADLDNDGRQDIIICGTGNDNIPHTYIYRNTTSGFILISDKLRAVSGHIVTADYDNDHDIDILLTGKDRYGNYNVSLYRNDNNWKFTEIFTDLYKKIDIYSPKPQFADFNDDGRLDILCGKVYRNDGNNVFTEMAFQSAYNPLNSLRMFDIDNDGTVELLGRFDMGLSVHKYNGVDSFLINHIIIDDYMGNIDIADVNGDKKPDIFSNNYPNAYIFINKTSSSNSIPTAPPALASSIGDSGFYSVTLKWKSGIDDKTPRKSLTYNLRVGTTSGGNDVFSSMTSTTTNNPLLKPGMGNVFNNTSWFLKDLSPGKYYWSVQTVDNSGLASAFSEEQTFQILEPLVASSFLAQGMVNLAAGGADFDCDKDMDLLIRNTNLEIYQQTAVNNYTIKTSRANSDILAIADMNNDNYPDIIARHNKILNQETFDSLEIFINNKDFTFSVLKLDTISASSVAIADFDNDGDNDILAHNRGYFLYENRGSMQYVRNTISIDGILYKTSISAIDIDKDGDYDFIITGKDSNLSTSKCHTYIYKNNGHNNFSLSQTIIPGIGPSAFQATAFAGVSNPADISWNDFNFDGYPDLLLTGDDEYKNNTCQILLNDGTGQMILTSLSPRPADKFSPTWLDFNNDGFLDIIIPKIGWNTDNTIYFNENNTSYTGFSNAIDAFNTAMYLKPIDVDQDKDKDILCTYKIPVGVDGYRMETKIYTNTNNFVNQAPNPPSTNTSVIDSFTVIINWNNGWDKLTGNNGLSYNIWVGTANNKADIVSPMADLTTGYRYVEALGNVGTNTTWKLENLPLGTYYWSVQSIDNSMTPSTWAPVKSFTLSALTANFSNDEVCFGFDTQLTDNSVTTHPIISWKWIIGGKTISTAQNPIYKFTTPGNNSVKLVVESSVAKDSITKNVYVKPVPEASFTNNTVCVGTSTTFTNTTSINGLTMSEWHWDFGDNSGSNVQNPGSHGYLVAGTYNVVLVAVSDNGCSDTIKKSIDVGLIPTAAVTLTGLPNFCTGDSVRLANSFTDTYTYAWQNGGLDITGATNATFTAKQSGSYTVKVTNPVGNCISTSSAVNILVKESPLQPAISYSGAIEFCSDDSLLLTAPDVNGLIYKWKLNGGSIGKDTSIHIARITGTYNLLVTNSDGCSSLSANSVEIKVNEKPVATSLSIPPRTNICENESVILGVTSSPSYSYQWMNEGTPIADATGNIYKVGSTGKYQLQISNSKGCSIKTNTIAINVNSMPVRQLIDSGNYFKGMCIGEIPLKMSIRNPIEGYSYLWYKNGAPISEKTVIEDFFEDGYYYAEADLNGCKSPSDSLQLDFKDGLPKPDIRATGTNVWYLSTSSEAKYYKWYYNGASISDASGNFYIAGQKYGTYRVSISNDNLCFTISDTLNIPKGVVGIEIIDPFEDVRIYPNPTTGMFTIEMNNNIFGELVLDIITQNGSKALNIRFDKSTEHFKSQIDLSGQSKGMYLINLSIEKYRAARKLLVE